MRRMDEDFDENENEKTKEYVKKSILKEWQWWGGKYCKDEDDDN